MSANGITKALVTESDGAPNAVQLFPFQDALVASLKATLEDPAKAWKLLHAHDQVVNGCEPEAALAVELPDLDEEKYRAERAKIHADFAAARAEGTHEQLAHEAIAGQVAADQGSGEKMSVWARLRALEARLVLASRHFYDASKIKATDPGPGRADAWGAVRNVMFEAQDMTSPQDIPDLWSFHDIEWLHWFANTNSAMSRNLAEAIAFGAIVERHTGWSSARLDNLARIDKIIYKIDAPVWPEGFPAIDEVRAESGRALFAENCAGCHEKREKNANGLEDYLLIPVDEIGTDPMLADNYNRPLKPGRLASDISDIFAVAMSEELEQVKGGLSRRSRPEPGRREDLGAARCQGWLSLESDGLCRAVSRKRVGAAAVPPQRVRSPPSMTCCIHRTARTLIRVVRHALLLASATTTRKRLAFSRSIWTRRSGFTTLRRSGTRTMAMNTAGS